MKMQYHIAVYSRLLSYSRVARGVPWCVYETLIPVQYPVYRNSCTACALLTAPPTSIARPACAPRCRVESGGVVGAPGQSRLTQHRGTTKAHSFQRVLWSAWSGLFGEEDRCQRSVCAAVSQRPAMRNAVNLRRVATMKRDISYRRH